MPSFRSAGTGTGVTVATYSVNAPSGLQAGDLMLACQGSDTGGSSDLTAPTGGATWNLLEDVQFSGAGTGAARIWWKIAGGSEPGTYTFNQLNTSDGVGVIAAIQNAAQRSPVHGNVVAGTGGNVDTPSTTPEGNNDLDVRFAVGKQFGGVAVTWTSPSGYTERADVQANNQFTSVTCGTKQLSSSAATGTQTFVVTTTPGRQAGFTLTVTDFPTPGPLVYSGAIVRSYWW